MPSVAFDVKPPYGMIKILKKKVYKKKIMIIINPLSADS